MKYNEFLKLARDRIEFVRHGDRHDIYRVKADGSMIPVPRHQSQEIKKGLQSKLLKQVGL